MKQNNMKDNIRLAATNLIIENGVKNTSLADISKLCGISKGTLYYHYATKDDLICDIASIHLKVITDSVLNCVQSIDNNSPENLIMLILDKISAIKVRGRIHMYLLCEAITGNEKLKLQIKTNYEDWKKTLKLEILKKVKSEKEAEALSYLLVSIVDGLVIQGLLNSKDIPYESITNYLVDKCL